MQKLKSIEIRLVFRQGVRIDTEFFRAIVKKNRFSTARFAFVVPYTVDKRSTIRNKLRRRIKEWVRKYLLFSNKGIDVVLVAKKQSVLVSRKKIYKDLEYLVSKIEKKFGF